MVARQKLTILTVSELFQADAVSMTHKEVQTLALIN